MRKFTKEITVLLTSAVLGTMSCGCTKSKPEPEPGSMPAAGAYIYPVKNTGQETKEECLSLEEGIIISPDETIELS